MPAVRSMALVVRASDVFETSTVATLFTRQLGKASGLAKGARRLKSPMQGGLDLLGVSDIVLLHKASDALDLIIEAVPIERFASLRRDLAALYSGYYIAELLSDLTDFHDPHPRLFDAAVVTLRNLGDPGSRAKRVFRFELACLRELGLMPALEECAHCGAEVVASGEAFAFGLATGGVLCPGCRPGSASRGDSFRKDSGGDPGARDPGAGLARARPLPLGRVDRPGHAGGDHQPRDRSTSATPALSRSLNDVQGTLDRPKPEPSDRPTRAPGAVDRGGPGLHRRAVAGGADLRVGSPAGPRQPGTRPPPRGATRTCSRDG